MSLVHTSPHPYPSPVDGGGARGRGGRRNCENYQRKMDRHACDAAGRAERVRFKSNANAASNARGNADAVGHLRPHHLDARTGNGDTAADGYHI